MLESVVPTGYQLPLGVLVRIVITVSAARPEAAKPTNRPSASKIGRIAYTLPQLPLDEAEPFPAEQSCAGKALLWCFHPGRVGRPGRWITRSDNADGARLLRWEWLSFVQRQLREGVSDATDLAGARPVGRLRGLGPCRRDRDHDPYEHSQR